MNNFLRSTAWIWHPSKPVTIKVTKLSECYILKFEIENSSIDLTLDRERAQELRDQINELLLVE